MTPVEAAIVLFRLVAFLSFVGGFGAFLNAARRPARRPVVTRVRIAIGLYALGQIYTQGSFAYAWAIAALEGTIISGLVPQALAVSAIAAVSGVALVWAFCPRRGEP